LTTTLAAPTRLDGGTTGAPDRVRPAQRQAAAALAQAGAFGVAAGLALVLADGRWLALHLFLAGTLVSAISGVSVLFAVTWSAAPCPPARRSALQRALVGAGAAGVAVTRHVDAPAPLLAVAALAFAAGLAMLAAELVVTVRRGVQRRFDAAVAWYVAALAAGLVAASLGAAMGAGWGGAGLRPAHVTLNLLGLVPYGATATGNISVTATLALLTFLTVEIAGIRANGWGYLNTIFYWNNDLPMVMRPLMFAILTPVELIGKITKPFALAIRLFANMTAGHIVLLAMMGLFFSFGLPVGIAPLGMAVAIMFLEIFVAFLQAFVFTLLSSVFIGLIREAHH